MEKINQMHSFNEFTEIISTEIRNLKLVNDPKELYLPIDYIMNLGGKRLRPAITLMSCELFGGDYKKSILPALGMEMFHNFTLVHDDIMDKAPVRRGFPTVHSKWDENRAILSGDAMLILANQLMLNASDDVLREVMELYNAYGLQVCEGQQFDMNFEKLDEITMKDYIKMIGLKTAALMAGCFKLGAVLAKTSEENKTTIEKFGFNLGISFQIEDDNLDVFGDYSKFGKTIGGDILSNKKTFLLIKALEIADQDTRNQIKKWYSSTDFDPNEKIQAVIEIFSDLDLKQLARIESKKYYELSLKHLENIDLPKGNIAQLIDLADYLINRDY